MFEGALFIFSLLILHEIGHFATAKLLGFKKVKITYHGWDLCIEIEFENFYEMKKYYEHVYPYILIAGPSISAAAFILLYHLNLINPILAACGLFFSLSYIPVEFKHFEKYKFTYELEKPLYERLEQIKRREFYE